MFLRLRQAESIPGWVLENRFDAVELVLRRRQEFDTLGRQLFVRLVAIGGLEHPGSPEVAAGEQVLNLRGRRRVIPAIRADLHENELELGLCLGPDRQPAEAVELLVHAELEAELLNVKLAGGVLIGYIQSGVGVALNHRKNISGVASASLLQSCGIRNMEIGRAHVCTPVTL